MMPTAGTMSGLLPDPAPRGPPVRGGNKLLEGEGRWRGWRGLWPQCPHELLVALARLEGRAALGQGGKGAGTTLCLRPSKPEQSQGHLAGGDHGDDI